MTTSIPGTPASPTPAPAAAPAATPSSPAVPPAVTPPVTPPAAPQSPPVAPAAGDPAATYADFTQDPDVQYSPDQMAAAKATFAKLGLTQEQAQELIDLQTANAKAANKIAEESFAAEMTQWETAAKADKEIGGDNYVKAGQMATNALNKFGTDGLKAILGEQNLGKHPEVKRFLSRIGAALQEDRPGNPGTPQQKEEDKLKILYPDAQN